MDCTVCFETFTTTLDTSTEQTCVNSSCSKCIAEHIKTQIQDGRVTVNCLCGDCDSLTYQQVDELINDLLFEERTFLIKRYDNNIVDKSDPTIISRIFYCDNCDEETRVEYNEIDSFQSFPLPNIDEDPVCCDTCYADFCDNCAKTNCDGECEYLMWEDCKHAANDEEKRCPKCRAVLVLESGCASVQCVACTFCFCWECLEYVSPKSVASAHKCKNFLGYDTLRGYESD